MASRAEIAILNDLTLATCHSADRCAAAARASEDGYRKLAIDQLCEDRRLLLIDLIRCLLLRGVPVAQVRRTVTQSPSSTLAATDLDLFWIDVEIAERKLHLSLRRALKDPALSDPVRELLSLHYLRIKLHHDEFEGLAHRQPLVDAVEAQVRAYHA